MGTTAAFTASAAGHRITVVGEVPAATVKAIAAAVQPE
jgi:negative regulator of sigma E activity